MLTSLNFAQNNTDVIQIRNAYELELSNYSCDKDSFRIMCDSLFNEQIESIFSTVVLNSSDIITNGSAIAFAQDKDKGTFSFNTTLPLATKTYMDIGLSYENKENFSLNFYSNQALTNDLGLKIGFLFRLNSTQFIKGRPCVNLNEEREQFMRHVKLNEYEIILNTNLVELQENLNREYQADAVTEQQLKTKTENIKILKNRINKLNALRDKLDNDDFQAIARKDFYEYDKENVNFTGHSVHWLNINGNFKNSRLTDKYIVINETLDIEKNDDIFKMNLEFSYNYFRDNYQIFYIQGFTRLNRGSYLDSPLYRNEKEFSVIQNPLNSIFEVALNNESILPYSYLERPYLEGQLGSQILWLFNKKKYFGFSFRASYNFPIGKDLLVPYIHNYNFLLGPTLRSNDSKDTTLKLSKSTITFLCGFEQVPFNVNAWDLFIVKASIGIPLTLFRATKI